MSSTYSHIPLPLCICSESQIPLQGPFLGQRYSFSNAGPSVSLCSGHGCAASLLRWVRSACHFTSPCRCFHKGRGTGIPRVSLSTSNTDPCQDNDTQVTLYALSGCKLLCLFFFFFKSFMDSLPCSKDTVPPLPLPLCLVYED